MLATKTRGRTEKHILHQIIEMKTKRVRVVEVYVFEMLIASSLS